MWRQASTATALCAVTACIGFAVPSHASGQTCVGVGDASGDVSMSLRSGDQTTTLPAAAQDSSIDLIRTTVQPADLVVRFHVAGLSPNRPGAGKVIGSWWAHFQAGSDRYWVLASSDAPVVNAGNWNRGGYHVWRNGRELSGVTGGIDTLRNTVVVKASRLLTGPVSGFTADSESTVLYAGIDGAHDTDLRLVDTATGDAVLTSC